VQFSMAERVIDVRGLHKSYGDVDAVRGIDLHVDRGEVFALLGPNGAGKTTTVEILEGYRERTAGEVSVLDHDPAKGGVELKRRIGIVLQSTGVDPYLTVRETIDLYAGYYPSPRDVDEVIDLVGLAEKRNTRVNKLSGGQQRRLDVAIALAGDPELLFLDEPTTGFDPGARRNAWEVVKNLIAIGKTVFLTTHFMDEAQYLADRVIVIANGLIVAEGPPASLAGRDQMRTRIRFRVPDGAPEPEGNVRRLPDGSLEIDVDAAGATKTVHDLTGWALDRGIVLESLEVTQPSLEDVYLQLTGAEVGT
jgi:ABC-2 type transport system ATP-binding protein